MRIIPAGALVGLILSVLLVPGANAWEIERPSFHYTIDERIESSKDDGVAAVGLGVHISSYFEGDPQIGDCCLLRATATSNTREIIAYSYFTEPTSKWYEPPGSQEIFTTGDDVGAWIYLPSGNPVRFYGGHGSAEYMKIWVCSNGFISFEDSEFTSQYNYLGIPNSESPNTIIAPFWRDLVLPEGGDASITWGLVPAESLYVITWRNVRNKINDQPQTFQVALEIAPGLSQSYRQSNIWFNYNSITLDDYTTIGIEDQRGLKGVSYDLLSLGNDMTLRFLQTSNSAFIQYLTIRLNRKNDPYATIVIERAPEWLRGYNVELKGTGGQYDSDQKFYWALKGLAPLLLRAVGFGTAGLFIGPVLIVLDFTYLAAQNQLSDADAQIDDDPQHAINYAKAQALDREFDERTVVDATLSILVFWRFDDENNSDHELTITAELQYAEFDLAGAPVNYETITTDASLKIIRDAGDTTSTAVTVEFPADVSGFLASNDQVDMYKFQVNPSQAFVVKMTPPSDCDFDLELLDANGDLLTYSRKRETGTVEKIVFTAGAAGVSVYYVKVICVMGMNTGYGMYNLRIYEYTPGGGGGGTPPLFEMI